MNKNILLIASLLVIALFLTGCSGQAATPNTQANAASTPAAADTSSSANPSTPTPANANSNSAVTSTSSAAVSPASTSSGPTKELDIQAYNFGFKVLNDVQINKGDTVKLVLTSAEGTHGLALPAFNVNTGPVSPGDTQTVEFVADQSGSFDYFCNVPCGPGHRSMRSTLVVN